MTGCARSYATLEEFAISGLPEKAYASVPRATVQRILQRASSFADTFLVDRYSLPLGCGCGRQCGFDPSLVDVVCAIAAYRVLVLRGYNPELGGDQVVRQGYDDAVSVLKRVANGQQSFQVCQSTPESLQPDVASNVPRGYGTLGGFGAQDLPVVGGMGGGFGTIVTHLSVESLDESLDDLLSYPRCHRQTVCGPHVPGLAEALVRTR